MKNPNNHGSVYKLQGKRRRPWIAKITVGRELVMQKTGKYAGEEVSRQTFKVIGYYPTKTEALDALTLHRKGLIPHDNMTLEDVYNEWSAQAFPKISDKTINNYTSAWSRLKPLHGEPIAEIRTTHWQNLIDAAPVGLSSKTKIKTVISKLYRYAMQNDIANKDYGQFVVLPHNEKKDKNVFTDIEIKKIEASPDAETILFLIYTGFRIQEMLDLTRFNVDLTKGIIIAGSKTQAGKNRIVPIHPKILPVVKKSLTGEGKTLFCRADGHPMVADKYRINIYYPVLDRLMIERRPPHTCRHTFATLLARAGVDTLSIQRMLGHSTYAFTADTYTHPDIEQLKKAINIL